MHIYRTQSQAENWHVFITLYASFGVIIIHVYNLNIENLLCLLGTLLHGFL